MAGGRRLIIEADGGSRGNPGPSGYGAVVMDAETGEVLAEASEAIGVTTNNVAEYRGLIGGLRAAKRFNPEAVQVRMDSKLVVEQMSGRWKVKTPHIAPLHKEANDAVRELGVRVTFAHIPRELNAYADRLANQAMDAAGTPAPPPPATWTDPDRTLPATQRLPGWNPSTSAPTTTVLLRHGESTLSIDRRFNGSSDPPLTERGEEQARAVADRLTRTRKGAIAVVISSPLQRARRTAEVVAQALDVELVLEPGFRETDFGAWEGLTYREVAEAYRDELAAWHADVSVAPGGGESFLDTEVRVRAARDRVTAAHPGETVLIVAHVTPIKVLTWQALHASPEVLFRTALDLASLGEIDWYPDGGSVLRRFNDASHLEVINPV